MRLAILAMAVAGVLLLCGPVSAASYFIWDDWGGHEWDAEKSTEPGDNLLCWAAAASNVLAWTGWGFVGGMTDEDQMFQYFQDHWTDQAGNPWYGWDWWFDGTNDTQGVAGWAQVDVPGGGFYPTKNFGDYAVDSSDSAGIMGAIDTFLHGGYGTSLWVGGPGAHLITVWGYDFDPVSGDYLGVHVTDSDDSKGGAHPRPDTMPYYDVTLSGGKWYLQDYYGSDNWYIGWAGGLSQRPAEPIPEPSTIALFGLGAIALVWVRRRRS